MSDTFSRPIPTQITDDIADCLARVKLAAGRGIDLFVERLNASNHEFNNPRHGLAVIDPDDPQPTSQSTQADYFTRVYVIHVWLLPSQTDGKSIDEWIDLAVAEVQLALCDDTTQAFRRGGLAIDTTPQAPTTFGPLPNSLAYIVNVPVEVKYRTATRNLFQRA